MARVPQVTSREALTGEPAPQPAPRQAPPTRKTLWVAYALHILGGGGFLGIHRFYLGYRRSGLAQLALGAVTLLLPLVLASNAFQIYLIPPTLLWYLADLFLMPGMTRNANRIAAGAGRQRNA